MKAIVVASFTTIILNSVSAAAEPSKVSPDFGSTSQVIYYPGKMDSIKDSAVLSAYLRLIALANDEIQWEKSQAGWTEQGLNDRMNLKQKRIEDAIQTVVSPQQLALLARRLREKEVQDSAPEFRAAMHFMEQSLCVCLEKLVDLHTPASDREFLKLKEVWKKRDGGFALIIESLDLKRIGSKKSAY